MDNTAETFKAALHSQYHPSREGDDISHLNEQQRANLWIVKGNVGISSKCIWAHMTGTITSGDNNSYPRDAGDFNRCMLLLEAVPEWKLRIHEMAAHGDIWAAMAERWSEISQKFIDEAGLNFSKGEAARSAYDIIKQARGF